MKEDHPESALVNLLNEQLDDILQQLKAKEEECNELIELIIQKDALIEDHRRILKSAAMQVSGIEY